MSDKWKGILAAAGDKWKGILAADEARDKGEDDLYELLVKRKLEENNGEYFDFEGNNCPTHDPD